MEQRETGAGGAFAGNHELDEAPAARWYARLTPAAQRRVAIALCRQVMSSHVHPQPNEPELAAWHDAHELLELLDDGVPELAAHAVKWEDRLAALTETLAPPAQAVYTAIAAVLANPDTQPVPLQRVVDVARTLGASAAEAFGQAVRGEDPRAPWRDGGPRQRGCFAVAAEVAIGLLHVAACLLAARLALAASLSVDLAQFAAVVAALVPVCRAALAKRTSARRTTTYLLSGTVCLAVGLTPAGRLLVAYLELLSFQ